MMGHNKNYFTLIKPEVKTNIFTASHRFVGLSVLTKNL